MSLEAFHVVELLADLAQPRSRTTPDRTFPSVDPTLMKWLPLSYTNLLAGETGYRFAGFGDDANGYFANDELTQRILKTATLRDDRGGGTLRVGWLWLAGRHPEFGQMLAPLLSLPVKVPLMDRMLASLGPEEKETDLKATGEPELSDLITDLDARRSLAKLPELPEEWDVVPEANDVRKSLRRSGAKQLRAWVATATAAAGCSAKLVDANLTPTDFFHGDQLKIVAGVALYSDLAQPSVGTNRPVVPAGTLGWWARQDIADTALSVVYGEDDEERFAGVTGTAEELARPMLLNASQHGVVDAATRQRLTVVSGPPGTGKTQAVAAVAFDQVWRGRSVLVVAPSDASVTALSTLMEQTPGPDPVVFGSSLHRLEVASRLTEHSSEGVGPEVIVDRGAVHDRSSAEVDRLRAAIATVLTSEQAAELDPDELMLARVEAPGLFTADADLDAAQELATSAARLNDPDTSRWSRRSARRDLERLVSMGRSPSGESVAIVVRRVEVAVAQRRNAGMPVSGDLGLDRLWALLIDAGLRSRRDAGLLLGAIVRQRDRTDRRSQRAVAAVAVALRSDRERRRELLAEVDADELLEPLPLWVSTVRDVDDLLPMRPGMFDMVIIDEASHIDQISAAPSLLRAKSALIAGDPRQLRHVSPVSGERVSQTLSEHGVNGQSAAAQLDVEQNSIFDAAASVQPPLLLDEHYRSMPHLIDFAAQRFYNGKVGVATRHPRNEHDDCIDVVEVDGKRDRSGVNRAEVDAIVDLIRSHDFAVGRGSVGVITPFDSQAAALEAALREAFDLFEINQLDLRVGTVHGFQGCERDVTYLSTCLDDTASKTDRSTLDDVALFNVMVTRARCNVTVVTSLRDKMPELLALYVRHGEAPQVGALTQNATEPWASSTGRSWPQRVIGELRDSGLELRTQYPVGRHEIDAVVGAGDAAVAIICGVHPGGAEAHIARHLELVGLGWTIREVFESQWGEQLPALAVELRSSTLG